MLRQINLLIYIIGFIILNIINTLANREILESYKYRIIVTIFSLIIFVIYYNKNELKSLFNNNYFFLYFIFSFLYLSRRIVDLFIFNIYWFGFEAPIIEMLISVSYIIIMPISLINITKIDVKFYNYFYLIFSFVFIINTFFGNINFGVVTDRNSAFINLGVETLGLYSAYILILSIIIFFKEKKSFITLLFNLMIMTLALYYLALASTRSVTIGSILIIGIFLIININKLKKKIHLLIFLLLLAIISFKVWINWFNILFSRFESGINSGKTGREEYTQKAVEMFMESPLLGNYHVIPEIGFFHNYFLDAFVSTGIFGGVIFTIINTHAIIHSIKWLKIKYELKYQFLGTFYLINLIFGMFNSVLYSTSFYWGSLIIVIVLRHNQKNISKNLKYKNKND